jgi:hypothetical protein
LITDNLKVAALISGSIFCSQYEIEYGKRGHIGWTTSYRLKDWNGELVRMGNNSYDNYYLGGSAKPWTFFTGGIWGWYSKALADYSNEEDMIASKTFYIGGSRGQTLSEDNRLYGWGEGYNANGSQYGVLGSGMLILGSGDTPPTKEDYKLESWIPTIDLKPIAFGTTSPKKYEDDFIGGFWATYYNVSEENKTVKEVGIISSFYKTIQYDDPTQTKILMAREVLENPVIIKPHEGCTFSFVIK